MTHRTYTPPPASNHTSTSSTTNGTTRTVRSTRLVAGVLAGTLTALLLAPSALAETIQVRSGESIQAAIDRALPGDEIKVRPGVYQENLVIDGRTDLTLAGRATLLPAAPGLPTLRIVNSQDIDIGKLRIESGAGGAIRIESTENVEIEKVQFNGNTTLAAVISASDSRAVRITRSKFKGFASVGIALGVGADLEVNESVVSQNKFKNLFGEAISIRGEQNLVSRNNIKLGRLAIRVAGPAGGEPNVIRENKISQPFGKGVLVESGRSTIDGNNVRLSVSNAISVEGSDHTVVANKVKDCCVHGVIINATDSLIIDNKVKQSILDGIVVNGNDNVLQNNDLFGSGRNGMRLEGSGNVVTGNKFRGNDESIDDRGDNTIQ